MSDQEKERTDEIPPPDAEERDVDTEVERPAEPNLSPGRLEEGVPESRPIDPKIGGPLIP